MADDEHFVPVIQLYPEYEDTVIWFPNPVPYSDARISARLQHDMEAWERFYYERQTHDYGWRTKADEERFATDGHRIAERLAEELGDQFQVEIGTYVKKAVRFRSEFGPTNPEAALAFQGIAREQCQVQQDLEDARRSHARGVLSIYLPGEEPSWRRKHPARRQGTFDGKGK